MSNLLSYTSYVETPFISVEIGGHTFGAYKKSEKLGNVIVDYPNYMDSISITKINGQLNTYNIRMTYQITPGDDPNFLEAIFSRNKALYGWQKIIINYGDMSSPSDVFRNEEAIITSIKSSVDFSSSKISYNLSCTSTKLPLITNSYNFPPTFAKPSDVLINLICNKTYGIQDVLTGMNSKEKIRKLGLIEADDKAVRIEAKENINLLSYINYLVSCMTPSTDLPESIIKSGIYMMVICDDVDKKIGGSYIKVQKVIANSSSSLNSDYELDIGYPGKNFVTSFNIINNDIWSIYYDYSQNLNQQKYVYRIGDDGKLMTEYSPALTTSRKYNYTTESSKSWWTSMTEFPIKVEVTIKGLLKPSILMDKIKVNTYFYGRKHISSGVYIITKQEDTVDSGGYKTKLSLTRVKAD